MSDEEPVEKKIDDEWKQRVQAEKRKAEAEARRSRARREQGGAGGAAATGADLRTLVATLAAQAQSALGLAENPLTGQRQVDLPSARVAIDLLGVLEEKTEGNLDEEEESYLQSVLYQLRMAFVEVQKQQAGEGGEGGEAGPGPAGPGGPVVGGPGGAPTG